ncbi:MAG: epoxyqueuosine reductase QueH, partial [Synergistaceae bacterium]|nr:epoxyqueuosine reductase QueH [Synergistaceae bacterium]
MGALPHVCTIRVSSSRGEGSSLQMLLHVCCAPDATVPVQELRAEGWDVVGASYGSNVQPLEEWERRMGALRVLMDRMGLSVDVMPYAPEEWTAHMEALGLMGEPEGGRRCAECFRLQLEAAARTAVSMGRTHLCTTLTISPHKDPALIGRIGAEVASARGLTWEDRVWRRRDGFLRSVRASREMGLYRQSYCGCVPSMKKAPPRGGAGLAHPSPLSPAPLEGSGR